MSAFPPFADLVPHAGPMVLLDALEAWEPGQAQCSVTVRADSPFAAEGRVDPLIAFEYMGQAVAACLGYEAYRGGEGVRVGMIIASRRFEVSVDALEVGAKGEVHVRRVRGSESLSHFEGSVRFGGEEAASAQLTLIHAEKPPE